MGLLARRDLSEISCEGHNDGKEGGIVWRDGSNRLFPTNCLLLAGADPKTDFAKDGLLDELKKAFAERALNAEIDHHFDKGEEDGRPNSRNGYGRKSVISKSLTQKAVALAPVA